MSNILNTKAAGYAALALVGAGALYLLSKHFGSAVIGAVADVNKGTPYEGAGVVGTLGNATNRISGGMLGKFGSWLGGAAFDFFNKPYDPNNPNTAATRLVSQATSPVRPQDKASTYAW